MIIHLLHLLMVMMIRWRYSILVGVWKEFSVEIKYEKLWC